MRKISRVISPNISGIKTGDKALAKAASEAGNVVTAVNLVYKVKLTKSGSDSLVIDENHIEMAEYPYDALSSACILGFVCA